MKDKTKDKIKEIYNNLSSSKIESFDSIINVEDFSSILKDRFVSELNKLNLQWDLEPTSINDIVRGISTPNPKPLKHSNNLGSSKNTNKFNIGVDLQSIKDFPIVKDPFEEMFYTDNFNKNEIAHCLKKNNRYESFAGIYAAKEAIFKIEGALKEDINIDFDKNGKPRNKNYDLSISHDNDYAIAVAFKFKDQEGDEAEERKVFIKDGFESIEQRLKITINKKQKRQRIVNLLFLLIILYLSFKDYFFY